MVEVPGDEPAWVCSDTDWCGRRSR
ncbi:MAG: hypothetical protein L0221_13540 [Chloroflexi bacterium]|nr:hypothetical protein [Chloroflexota bacterium]